MNSMEANHTVLLTASLCLLLVVALNLIKFLHKYWWTPLRIQHAMNLQGINGPPYKFIHGNNKENMKLNKEALSKPMASLSHDILPRVQAHVYARVTLYGNGLVAAEGQKWAKQRKLANYAFHGESLKSMTWAMIASVELMLQRWKQFEGKEIEVFEEFRLLTSEVISRTAFGTSYLDGEKIFDMLRKLTVMIQRQAFKSGVKFPVISEFWKSADSIEADKLAKGIHNSVMEIVKNREEKVFSGEANSFGSDFLGSLLNAFHDSDRENRLSEQDLVDECKTFYFAGHETANSALAWTVFLLAIHQDWQEKARKEVFEVFGNQNPNTEGIGRLRIKFSSMAANLAVFLTEPELVKELLKSNDGSGAFPKRTSRERKENENNYILKMIGDGLVTSQGEKWAKQRKLANYAFHGESLKSMTPAVIASVETMIERWKQFEGKEIEVFEEFRLLTSEVISRTAFGTSYLEGEKIFDMLTRLTVLASRNMFKTKFPVISKFWKSADSIESDKLVKGIHDSIMKMVKKREEIVFSGEANSFGNDFLGLLVKAFHDPDKKNRLSEQDLVDECKTFYFAGQETTNSALAWTILLLAIYPDWQEKARKEVIEVFGNQNPHSEGIGRLKIAAANNSSQSIQSAMRTQGIKGPPYRFLHGNTKEIITMINGAKISPMEFSYHHHVFDRIQPHIYSWKRIYGNNFLCWLGSKARLVVTEPELAKEILNNKDGAYPKPVVQGYWKKLTGDGLGALSGEKWAKQRKIANYAFHGESLKGMVPEMIASVEMMLERWRKQEGKEIEVFQEFKVLTSEIISRTAFGSSYLEGKQIFDMLTKMTLIIARNAYKIHIPVLRKFYKTEDDIESDKLEEGIRNCIKQMIRKREEKIAKGEVDGYSDYLGLLMKVYHSDTDDKTISISAMDVLIDECKTFYFAGQETTMSSLTWTIFLLAIHPEWQDKARMEVLELIGQHCPTADSITKFKTSAMRSQGIKGPSYRFLYGNTKQIISMRNGVNISPMELSHHVLPKVHPHIYTWKRLYGKNFLYWHGPKAQLVVSDPELVKEILNNKDGDYPKKAIADYWKKLLGFGLASSSGEKWVKQRKLANYAFHAESLKGMIPAMIESVEMIKVLKTQDDIESDKLEQGTRKSFTQMIRKREETETGQTGQFSNPNDFLGLLMKAYHDPDKTKSISVDDLIDECKTFYFAGHETTASSLTWTLLLLAMDTEWQDKARNEVVELIGQQIPTPDNIGKLKIVRKNLHLL
ncbi:Cytochrome P450 [Corchorus olitorius]|uniref:Cytochrome P450 n=1 Tax=Corchorus olitorius TaxID=93759 RepID=A0A1R3HPA6_9ROSI|nr:Cytochrome P450 [Corchorus olitorius]